jgi:enoyl-CoA hydratase
MSNLPHMAFSSDVLTVEIDGPVATLWLDRPEKLNAMSGPFWVDIPRALEQLGADSTVRAIVIAGRGSAFSVGIDLNLLAEVTAGSSESDAAKKLARYEQIKHMQYTMTAIAECPQPVIAAVHGYCLGAGMDLITACDIRVAARDAVLSKPPGPWPERSPPTHRWPFRAPSGS